MQPAAPILAPWHPLHGARIRPVGYGYTAILLDAAGGHPAMSRLVVPPSARAAVGVDFGGARTVWRHFLHGDVILEGRHDIGVDGVEAAALDAAGQTTRLVRTDEAQRHNWHRIRRYLHPTTEAIYDIPVLALAHAVTTALIVWCMRCAHGNITDTIVWPYSAFDGVRVVRSSKTQVSHWGCDFNTTSCAREDGPCVCEAEHFACITLDDIPTKPQIVLAGSTVTLPRHLLISAHTEPRAVCARCPNISAWQGLCLLHRPCYVSFLTMAEAVRYVDDPVCGPYIASSRQEAIDRYSDPAATVTTGRWVSPDPLNPLAWYGIGDLVGPLAPGRVAGMAPCPDDPAVRRYLTAPSVLRA